MPYKNIRRLAKERIAAIPVEIRKLRDEEEKLRGELADLNGASYPAPVPVDDAAEQSGIGPYAFLKPQKAVLRYLQDNPGPHTTVEIHDAVIAGGMNTKSKRTRDSVWTALSRQAEKHGGIEKLADGRWRATLPLAPA